jgi:hypothetical protein
MRDVITVYVSVGNSDDKLSQADWSAFVQQTRIALSGHARETHGEWYSLPDQPYQNACFCVVLADDHAPLVREDLTRLRVAWGQQSVAWAEVPVTEFI